MRLNAGQLTETVQFLREVAEEEDGSGGWKGGWIPLITTRAEVKRVRGSRDLEASQIVHNQPYEIITRFRVDVTINPQVKIVHRGRDIILHSLMDEDFKRRVYKYFGFSNTMPDGGIVDEASIQLYETGDPQQYEDGGYQRYEV